MTARNASVLLAAFCFLTPAFAQSAPDPAAIAIARDLLVITHATDNVKTGMELATPMLVMQLKRDKADLPDDVIAKFTVALRAELEASLPLLLDVEAKLYAQHYTVQELTALKAFYQTELGQKMIVESPVIAKEILPMAQAWGMAAGQQAMKNVLEKLRAQGVKI
jgi:hypothetical protein